MQKFTLLLLLLSSGITTAQRVHTLSFKENQKIEQVSINDLAWIEGHWQGEAFGGLAEEIWSAPKAGSMMFVFRHIVDDKVIFFESGGIIETPEGLVLKLKHFHSDMKGWEEKDKTIDFKFIRLEKNKAYFDNMTFEKINDDEMNIYVVMEETPGSENEVKFNYKKQK
jgi:hypothetical protein